MRCSHKTLILLAGFVWLAIGIWLLSIGLQFILDTVRTPTLTYLVNRFSITNFLMHLTPDRAQAVTLCIVLSLFLGYFKGKFVLAKSVARQVERIASLPNPASLKYLYNKSYYLLICFMILLGIMMRFLPITLDTRGAIDVVIGAALINGAMLYGRALFGYNKLKKRNV